MSIGVKSLEERELEFTRKVFLFVIVTLSMLIGVGLSLFISLVLMNKAAPPNGAQLISIISSMLISGCILYYCYKNHFVCEK